MDRDPAIHIKQSDLLRICKEEGVTFPEDFVTALLLKASKIKIHNRVMIMPKSKATTKAARTTATADNIVSQFNSVYQGTLSNHDRRAMPIHKGTRQWLALKEVATAAHNFAKDYKIKSVNEAFKLYVGLGIAILGANKVTIYRMKGVDYKIRGRHENAEILKWVDPLQTQIAHVAWDRSLKNFYSLNMEVNQDQLAEIARASQDAKEIDADINDWMDAQFDRWAYQNDMPEFSQLHGDNAKLAYVKYMAKHGKKYTNEAEKQHFDNIKDGKKIHIKGEKRKRG